MSRLSSASQLARYRTGARWWSLPCGEHDSKLKTSKGGFFCKDEEAEVDEKFPRKKFAMCCFMEVEVASRKEARVNDEVIDTFIEGERAGVTRSTDERCQQL